MLIDVRIPIFSKLFDRIESRIENIRNDLNLLEKDLFKKIDTLNETISNIEKTVTNMESILEDVRKAMVHDGVRFRIF